MTNPELREIYAPKREAEDGVIWYWLHDLKKWNNDLTGVTEWQPVRLLSHEGGPVVVDGTYVRCMRPISTGGLVKVGVYSPDAKECGFMDFYRLPQVCKELYVSEEVSSGKISWGRLSVRKHDVDPMKYQLQYGMPACLLRKHNGHVLVHTAEIVGKMKRSGNTPLVGVRSAGIDGNDHRLAFVDMKPPKSDEHEAAFREYQEALETADPESTAVPKPSAGAGTEKR